VIAFSRAEITTIRRAMKTQKVSDANRKRNVDGH
jgi:hypothetical protein